MLTIDLTVYVSGVDLMDAAGPSDGLVTDSVRDTGAEVVSQWEAELLQEMLQEFLQGATEDGDAKAQVRTAHLNTIHKQKQVTWLPFTSCFLL